MKAKSNSRVFVCVAVGAALLAAWAAVAQNSGDALLRGFQNPPDSARPRVWWHWMSGNITKDGIKKDLEWMKRSGIAGFQNFDAGLSTPQIVEKRLAFMTPEWKDAFRFATSTADQLGLEMAIASSPGWSEAGGPWVTPVQAMKKYVWSETRVEGGRPFTGTLPKPPSTTGSYQNLAGGRGGANGQAPPQFYADAAVVAYRAPESDRSLAELQPKVTSSGGAFTLAALTDGDLVQSTTLPAAPAGEKSWIQFEFSQPQTVHGLTLVSGGGGGRGGFGGASSPELEAGDDGRVFTRVAPVAGRTLAFPAVTARFFRVAYLTPQPQTAANGRGGVGGFGAGAPPAQAAPPAGAAGGRAQAAPAAPAGVSIAECVLHTGAVVNRFQEKAAFSAAQNIYAMATPPVAPADGIAKSDVIDLTSQMRPDGSLDWTPPAGRWVVLRIGYSLTGQTNSPASPEATGLEVDKLNAGYVKAYFDNYLGQYKDATGGLMGKKGLQYIVTDSWEAGVSNWTDNLMAEFAKRRGYSMTPWLPVLTGRVVETADASDRFLWDFRKTLSDLVAENYYDRLTTILHGIGMGRYSESHESGRAYISDGMEVKRNADIPMSAMWTQTPGVNAEQYGYNADIRESASVAHIYGQNLVAAESLTARSGAWSWSPETLKPTADKEMAMGLNRFVIHTSVHQPVDDKIPGLGLGPYGQWFTRHETWAEQAKVWTTYLARSAYMLQQGKFTADVIYYYGEDSNITALFANHGPDIPSGYNFDYVNADAILHKLSVVNGRIATPSGMSYRMLALDSNARHMSLDVLKKLRDLVAAGAVVVGPKPIDSPSQADDQAQFKTIADQLWGPGAGTGRVLSGQTVGGALASLAVAPDFDYTRPSADTSLLFLHRTLPDGEVYWVNNRNPRAETLDASFRVAGKAPEIWHPETGATEAAAYRIANGRTIVPLRLDPSDAVFVVFRRPTTETSHAIPAPVETKLGSVNGSWDVAFLPVDRGAPAKIALAGLASWSENSDPGVKYFSGTGVYTKTVQAPAAWLKPDAKVWLDLGDVKNIAEVSVNGKPLGVVWRPPFRVDATSALKPGPNTLEIKVINLWVNRLIGDQQPNVTKKYTYTAQQFYNADSPLLPSGLLGPVDFVSVTAK